MFYARIASESGDFNIADVIDNICDKLVHRHPHIYSDIKVKDAKEVKNNWEKLVIYLMIVILQKKGQKKYPKYWLNI